MFDDLVLRGLVKAKKYDNGLTVYKYARKVFYDNLWNEDPLLLDARGMVLDEEGRMVIWPFTKVFNYGENGTTCEPDRLVDYVRKVNGFMACAKLYKGEWLYSTTGSLDSDYVAMAKKHIEKLNWLPNTHPGYVFMFEIVDEADPHIVPEETGAYLIGIRAVGAAFGKLHGAMATEYQLDNIAEEIGAKRPQVKQATFKEVLEELKTVEHEGFMVRDAWTNETLMKLKSPHYLTKKFLMRMGDGKVDTMYSNKADFLKTIDEEFYTVVHYITGQWTAQEWKRFTDAERRSRIEDFFHCTRDYT